jgi:translocation and assembly module TamA
MAFGRRKLSRAAQGLLALAMMLLAFCPAPAFAQGAGRVAVEGMPASFNDELRRLLREEPKPESLFEARRQAERAAAIVSRLLESEGYYQAEVESYADGVETFTRGVRVTTGPLFIYTTARIDFLGGRPDEQTVTELQTLLGPLDPGIPARAQPVIETGDALLARLRAGGYPDAISQPVDALADGRDNTVEIAFQLQPGRRASFGDVSYTGLGRTRLDFLEKLKPWKPGERYTPQKLDEFRGRLAETGLFDSAAARLAPQGEPDANGLVSRDVLVELRERDRHTITLGATASTSDGSGIEGGWERRNLTGRGDSLKVDAQIATLERRLETTWRRPHIGRYGRNVSFGAKVEDFETDAFDQTGGSVSATIEEQLTQRVRASVGAETGYASILDDTSRSDCLAKNPGSLDCDSDRRDVYLLSATGTAEYIGVRDILDPRDGLRARFSVEPGLTTGDTEIGYTRLLGEASIYFDIGSDNLIGALRGRAGTIFGGTGVPPDRLFYAGGGGSVRGYEYQSLSPVAPDATTGANLPTGGRSLVEMSAELRYRATNSLGYVAFVDAGGAFDADSSDAVNDSLAKTSGVGAGFGVRYYAGFGPLRADIAVPLSKRDGDADFQVYISIGQAF